MTQATLSRGGTSVTFQVEENSGAPVIAESISKPEQELTPVSQVNPRVSDQFASVLQFTVTGYIDGSDAYERARVMAEDLVKPHGDGDALTLDLSNADGFGSYSVAPSTANACELTYNPGERNWVRVALRMPQVDRVIGGSASDDQTGSGATAGNGGSVTLTNPATSDSVTITDGLNVSRSVGRPNTEVRADPTEVVFIDKNRSAEDTFEIGGRIVSNTARADSQTLVDILSASRGRDALTLTFDNNLYGLGSYTVAAVGGEAGRRVVNASEPGMVAIRNLTLQTVFTT